MYTVQNNLLYFALSNLDAATYQVCYQLKILTTAVFSMVLLQRKFSLKKWAALFLLTVGVSIVEVSNSHDSSKSDSEKNSQFIGLVAVLCAACTSGFSGVYFEKILKGSDVSVWMRNVQLALFSVPMGFLSSYISDGDKIGEHGFFHGYDNFVWFTVIQNALGGLLVAVVVKYADNILKGFACSLAIIITCVASIFIFDFSLSLQFIVGAGCVIGSIFLYGYVPKKPTSLDKI